MIYTDEYINDICEVIKLIPDAEALRGSSILITGATGLIGSSVADILLILNRDYGFEIKLYLAGRNEEGITGRFDGFEEGRDYTFVRYDATQNLTDLISVDYIIHGASNADPVRISSEPVETMLANIMGLNQLLTAADKDRLKRILYISSSEVYGINKSFEPFKEDDLGYVDILNPRSSYPSSKRAAETLCISYAEEYKVDAVIVRPGHIYGPVIKLSDSRASAQFSVKAARGEKIVMKSLGEQLRSYCHVLDCASAILTVLIKGENKNAYNISAKQAVVTIRCMAEEFAAAGGVDIIFDVPTDAERKSFNVMPCSALDASKLEALGWKAAYDMKKGATQTVRMLKEILSTSD